MRPAATALAACALGACGFSSTATPTDAGPADAAVDAPDGPPVAAPCFDRWHDGTIRFGAPEAIPQFATQFTERDPFLAGTTLYVSSTEGPLDGDQNPTELPDGATDIWVATSTDGLRFSSVARVAGLSAGTATSKIALTADRAIVARKEPSDTAGINQIGFGGDSDLFESTYTGTGAALVAPTFATTNFVGVNTVVGDYDPWISPDGKTLYYAPGGAPQHIATATRAAAGMAFGAPAAVDLGEGTAATADPYLTADQTVILYTLAANGHGKLRYATRAAAQGPFGPSADVPDVAGTIDDGDPILSDDGCRLYFGSDRAGPGFTGWDIYVAVATP